MTDTLVIYRSAHPDVIRAWEETGAQLGTWQERVQRFLDERGLSDRLVYTDPLTNEIIGISRDDTRPIPPGWRLDQRRDVLVPHLATREGKDLNGRLGGLRQPDHRDALPGMPRLISTTGQLLTCGAVLMDGAVWVTWSRPVPEDRIDLSLWRRAKASEYFAAAGLTVFDDEDRLPAGSGKEI